MKRLNILWILLQSAALIVFNAIFFTFDIHGYSAVDWISYGFLHFIFVLELIWLIISRKIYGISLIKQRTIELYSVIFLIEMIIAAVFILLDSINIKQALITQLIITGVYLVLLLSVLLVYEYKAKNDRQFEPQKQDDLDSDKSQDEPMPIPEKYDSSVMLMLMKFLAESKEWNVPKELTEFNDLVEYATHCCQYTYDELSEIDKKIKEQTNALKSYLINHSLARIKTVINELLILLNEREQMIVEIENRTNQ